MSLKDGKLQKVLLVGPLPPPWGGATVSFKLFYEYCQTIPNLQIRHANLPYRYGVDSNPPGGVNHWKTFAHVCLAILSMPFVSSAVVFGSKGFCFSYGIVLLLFSKLFRKSFHMRFFGGHPTYGILTRFSAVLNILFNLLYKADGIVVQTVAGSQEFPVFLQEKIEVISNYRPEIIPASSENSLQPNTIRFVNVGGITKEKGINLLLTAFDKVQKNTLGTTQLELHLFGASNLDMLDQIEKTVNVSYHGKVENKIIRGQLPTFSVFVFPSIYSNEGHPGAIIEALMAGLPVIASDLPGCREVIQDSVNGLLFSAGDVDQLTEKMIALVTDNELHKQLGQNALDSGERFKAENVLPKLAAAVGLSV